MLATLGCERYFGREAELGTIERGKLADFILVAGDPTKDISQMRQTRMTMVGGVAYYPAEIFEHLAIKPFCRSASGNSDAVASGQVKPAFASYARMRKLFAAACLLLAACTATPPPEEPTGPYFSTTFRPVAENGEVIAIDVATRIVGPEGKTFGLMAPIVYPGSSPASWTG